MLITDVHKLPSEWTRPWPPWPPRRMDKTSKPITLILPRPEKASLAIMSCSRSRSRTMIWRKTPASMENMSPYLCEMTSLSFTATSESFFGCCRGHSPT